MATTEQIQSNALAFADSAMGSMSSFASNAVNFAYTPINIAAAWNSPAYVLGYNGGVINSPDSVEVPGVSAERPNDPALLALPTISLPTMPELIAAEPVLSIPQAPSATLPSAPGSAPQFAVPATPDAPTFSLPDAPVFSPVAIPDAPILAAFEFSEALPENDLTAPSDVFSFSEAEYSSPILSALKGKLLADLSSGGYGIETQDEEALWERERSRQLQNMEAAIQESARQAAARGLMAAPGAMNEAFLRAQNEAKANASSVSRDIALKRADLYVDNRRFTIEQSKQVEDLLIRAHGSLMERSLVAARTLVELGIAAFNAKAANYALRLDSYKASAAVYESLIRAQMAKVEQYKAQVEGARLGIDAQRIHAEVYRTQLDGVNAMVNIYRTEMEAAKVAADVEAVKLQGFRLSVDAYSAQVAAKSQEFQMYEAQIKGQMAKVELFDSQVRAYGVTAGAYKTKVEAQDVLVRSVVQANQVQLDSYRSNIQRYTADLQAAQNHLSATISKHDSDVRLYGITVDSAIKASGQNIEAAKANADIAVAHANVLSSAAIHAGQVLVAHAGSSARTMASLSSAYGSVSSAALSAATGIQATISSG